MPRALRAASKHEGEPTALEQLPLIPSSGAADEENQLAAKQACGKHVGCWDFLRGSSDKHFIVFTRISI